MTRFEIPLSDVRFPSKEGACTFGFYYVTYYYSFFCLKEAHLKANTVFCGAHLKAHTKGTAQNVFSKTVFSQNVFSQGRLRQLRIRLLGSALVF